jgi:hypothetical protein
MASIERAARFLNEIDRGDLAGLINHSTYEYGTEELWYDIASDVIELTSPRLYSDAIEGLPEWDQKRIAEAIHGTHQGAESRGAAPSRLVLKSTDEEVVDTLFAEIAIQRDQMIAVATGRGRIQDLNDYYKARRRRIAAALADRGIEDPNPFDSLWDWYRKWKAEFESYSERCRYIVDLYKPLISLLVHVPETPVPAREPTGWERVDRAVAKARQRLNSARHEEDYQTVGLLCREVLISVGQAVYDPVLHVSPDGVRPSATDAGRMIESFFAQAAAGSTNENVRKHARAALQLAVELQHKRTADFRAAALCLEATSSVTNIVAILSGQRDREMESPA